jgi:hypothetical protein
MQSNVLLSKNLPGKSVACLTIRPSILANFVPEMIGVEFLSNHQLRCDKRDQVDEMTLLKRCGGLIRYFGISQLTLVGPGLASVYPPIRAIR